MSDLHWVPVCALDELVPQRGAAALIGGRQIALFRLMPEDEVLLCLFSGPEAEVRAVSERAGLPFERILACVGVGWRAGTRGGRR